MIQDLHSHTYYSFCGGDTPDVLVQTAIDGGIDMLGITDHNYGIGYGRHGDFVAGMASPPTDYERTLTRYFDHIDLIKQKYQDRIHLLRGIEICTLHGSTHANYALPDNADISFFDYCIVENLDWDNTLTNGDIFPYAKRLGTPLVGIAHTDLFAHLQKRGEDPKDYFKRLAEQGIFWELNVNYDATHGYREHAYVADFFADEKKQEIVRESGAKVSIGFDGHRAGDYLPARVADFNQKLSALGIQKPFEA